MRSNLFYIISDVSFELLSITKKDFHILSKSFIEIIKLSKGELKITEKIKPKEDILIISISAHTLLKILENKGNIDAKNISEFLIMFINQIRKDTCFKYFLFSNPFNLIKDKKNYSKSLPIKDINVSRDFLLKYKLAMENIIQSDQNISSFDISDLVKINSSKSLKQFLFTQTYIDRNNYHLIAERIIESADYLRIEIVKVLALDLDNTLWGGVLREDGKENLLIGGHNPKGELYKILQQLFKDLKESGILLALVTKNNHNDVIEAFNFNDFMPLQKNDFVAIKASDLPKSQLINQLSEELNISLNHFIFLDDSRFERKEVKENTPDVYVLELPDDKYKWIEIILSDIRFSKAMESISCKTKKDNRTEKYVARQKRFELKESLKSKEDYYETWLKKLDQRVTFKSIKKPTIRIVELFARTNQFNSCGNKYSFEQLNNMLKNNYKIIEVSLKDNFGDEGVISVLVLKKNNKLILVNDFIMSCRIFGRYIEEIILFSIPTLFGKNQGEFKIKLDIKSNGKNLKSTEFLQKISNKNGVLSSDKFHKDIIESTAIDYEKN